MARIAALAAILFVLPSTLYAEEHYSVQAGSLGDKARAQKLMSRLLGSGFECASEVQGDQYKVICGNFKDLSDVKAFRQKLRSKGYADAFAVRVIREGESSAIPEDAAQNIGKAVNGNRNGNSNLNRNSRLDEYYSVQVGSIGDKARARKLMGKLSGSGVDCMSVSVGFKYSVICGKLESVVLARELREKLKAKGYGDSFAVHVSNGGVIKDLSEGVDPEDKLAGAIALVEASEGEGEYYSVQVGSLGDRTRAEKLVSRLWSIDLECVPIGYAGKYKVLCGRFNSVGLAKRLKQLLISKGYADAFTVRVRGYGGPEDEFVNINKNLPGSVESESMPSPKFQPLARKKNLWGRDGGHVHPFTSVSSVYTDNLYSSNEIRRPAEEDTVVVTSVGLWLSLPSVKEPIGKVSTVPGGLGHFEILPYHKTKRFAFLSYRAENRNYSDHDYENATSHHARGYLGYKSPAGHRIILDDIYIGSQSLIGNSVTGTTFVDSPGEYTSNRLSLLGSIRLASRTSVNIEHLSYVLDYDSMVKSILDRGDSLDRVELFFNYTPKTRFSLGYALKNMDYVMDIRKDKREKEYFLGIYWDITGRTDGRFRYGVSKSEREGAQSDSSNDLTSYAGNVRYRLSPKTAISVDLYRASSGSDDVGSDYYINERISTFVRWKATSKILTRIGIVRADNSYYTVVAGGIDRLNRVDTRHKRQFMFSYALNRNVAFELGATFHSRSSSSAIHDFDTRNEYAGVAVSF
ncbi:SPOR domain-containing protein [Nitrospirota bacterium]